MIYVVVQVAGKEVMAGGRAGAPDGQVQAPAAPGETNNNDNPDEANSCFCIIVVFCQFLLVFLHCIAFRSVALVPLHLKLLAEF